MKIFAFILIFILGSLVQANDLPEFPQQASLTSDKNLVWNKWDTRNFIVLSLDKSQGLELKEKLDNDLYEFLRKWNIKLSDSKVQVKLMCVPNEDLLLKLFNIKSPQSEVRYDINGGVAVCAIWIDFNRIHMLPILFSEVFLSDGLSVNDYSLVVNKGIRSLEQDLESIKSNITTLENFDLDLLFNVDKEKWQSLDLSEKEKFNKQSCVTCLFLRREFGERLFCSFLSKSQNAQSLLETYGFENKEQFAQIIKKYAENLAQDIKQNKTPSKYLKIE